MLEILTLDFSWGKIFFDIYFVKLTIVYFCLFWKFWCWKLCILYYWKHLHK